MTAMPSSPEILELRDRIARKRAAGRSTFRELVRLQLLVQAELEASLEQAQRAAARERREPGSFQREMALDDL